MPIASADLSTSVEQEIHRLHAAGDYARAMTLAVNAYQRRLSAYFLQRLGMPRAVDAYSELLWRAWRAFKSFQWGCTLFYWLMTIARNVAVDALRGKRRDRKLDPLSGLSSEAPDLAESVRSMTSVLEVDRRLRRFTELLQSPEVSDEDRELLSLAAQELTAAQLGEILGIEPNTASQRLRRARERYNHLASRTGVFKKDVKKR